MKNEEKSNKQSNKQSDEKLERLERGKNLKKMREERRMTQKQLAELLGCSPQTIYYYENPTRERGLSLEGKYNVDRIAQILDVDVDCILYGKELSPYVDRRKHFNYAYKEIRGSLDKELLREISKNRLTFEVVLIDSSEEREVELDDLEELTFISERAKIKIDSTYHNVVIRNVRIRKWIPYSDLKSTQDGKGNKFLMVDENEPFYKLSESGWTVPYSVFKAFMNLIYDYGEMMIEKVSGYSFLMESAFDVASMMKTKTSGELRNIEASMEESLKEIQKVSEELDNIDSIG